MLQNAAKACLPLKAKPWPSKFPHSCSPPNHIIAPMEAHNPDKLSNFSTNMLLEIDKEKCKKFLHKAQPPPHIFPKDVPTTEVKRARNSKTSCVLKCRVYLVWMCHSVKFLCASLLIHMSRSHRKLGKNPNQLLAIKNWQQT